ncbi:MAG TPA: OsmC family protein [Kofleriaceae bacterium]|nr:OsmC family protein [Kofleriaceae bacterium]
MDSTRLATGHLTSRPARYAQSIRIGHHELVADEPVALGGGDAGIAPYGLLLASLAACTAITLRMYAERKGWELGEVRVDLEMTREGDVETVARTISCGAALSEEQLRRLGEIADKTPVTKTLKRSIAITTTVR